MSAERGRIVFSQVSTGDHASMSQCLYGGGGMKNVVHCSGSVIGGPVIIGDHVSDPVITGDHTTPPPRVETVQSSGQLAFTVFVDGTCVFESSEAAPRHVEVRIKQPTDVSTNFCDVAVEGPMRGSLRSTRGSVSVTGDVAMAASVTHGNLTVGGVAGCAVITHGTCTVQGDVGSRVEGVHTTVRVTGDLHGDARVTHGDVYIGGSKKPKRD
jgi:hypothetical protein